MKTSLELDDRLYQAARIRAARERTTVRALVEQGLAAVLGLGPPPAPQAGSSDAANRDLADLTALCEQVRGLPLLTDAAVDELLGYDRDGSYT